MVADFSEGRASSVTRHLAGRNQTGPSARRTAEGGCPHMAAARPRCRGDYSSFFSGSFGSGGSMVLRGSILSRIAASYTKLATMTAACFKSSGCRRS